MDKSWDETFIDIACLYAEHSSCSKYHVGAVITRDKRIISTGYNGVPTGQKHCNQIFKNINFKEDLAMSEKHHEWSLKNEIHAEGGHLNPAVWSAVASESASETKITITFLAAFKRFIQSSKR